MEYPRGRGEEELGCNVHITFHETRWRRGWIAETMLRGGLPSAGRREERRAVAGAGGSIPAFRTVPSASTPWHVLPAQARHISTAVRLRSTGPLTKLGGVLNEPHASSLLFSFFLTPSPSLSLIDFNLFKPAPSSPLPHSLPSTPTAFQLPAPRQRLLPGTPTRQHQT